MGGDFCPLPQIEGGTDITYDYEGYVRTAFAHTGPRNPLNGLEEGDKWLLVSLLTVYLALPLPADHVIAELEDLETFAETARQTKAWAKKLRQARDSQFTQVLQSMPSLKIVLGNFHDLPPRLEAFGILLGGLLDQLVGKRGQKRKLMKNEFLLMASEFVRLKTNRYNDEHLAELIQSLSDNSDLSDLSGDAIHKKREHFKRTYPLVYAYLFNKVQDFKTPETPSLHF